MEPPELREELRDVFICDASSRVLHVHDQILTLLGVTSQDSYESLVREFKRILYQIDEDLFETTRVSDETWKSI